MANRSLRSQLDAWLHQSTASLLASSASPSSMSLSSSVPLAAPKASCRVLSGPFETMVQLVLGVVALCSLYAKWVSEKPRRPFRIWLLDALKQGFSAGFVHVFNLVFSILIADFVAHVNGADQCAYYFLSFFIDTTLGVYIAFLLLRLSVTLAHRFHWPSLQYPGRYGYPPSLRVWALQCTSWISILIVMKILVSWLIYACRNPLGWFASMLFFPIHAYPRVELLVVMIGCPLLMNMLQFWIQDSFLKDRAMPKDGELYPLVSPTKDKTNCCLFTNATTVEDMYDDLG